jgi:diacylglycerol O-acyltransferase / wax synthase
VNLAGSMVGDVVHPSRILTLAGTLASGGRALAKVLALPPDAHTALTGHTGRSKRVVWTDPIDLDEVKVAAHAADVTVNDLLLTAVSGALRAYLAREDGHAPDIRAIVPYNIRPLDQPLPAELGNKFGLVFLTLPVSVDDPRERLAELRRRMGAIKNSAEGVVTFEVLDLVGHTPYVVEQVIVDIFASKGTAVMTNVPGPRRPVYLAGRKLGGTIGWPPESGNIAMGVSIISYDGSVIVGLMTDTRLVRDPQSILDQVKVELDELMRWCTLSIVGT